MPLHLPRPLGGHGSFFEGKRIKHEMTKTKTGFAEEIYEKFTDNFDN